MRKDVVLFLKLYPHFFSGEYLLPLVVIVVLDISIISFGFTHILLMATALSPTVVLTSPIRQATLYLNRYACWVWSSCKGNGDI